MEHLINLFVMIFIFVIAVNESKKKKAKRSTRLPEQNHKQAAAAAARAVQKRMQQATQTQPAQKPEPPAAQDRAQREPDCEKRPIHLHSVSRGEMEAAAEGEDPCHPGARPAQTQDDAPAVLPDQDALAQELLRGIVVSEILKRPCERAAMQRNRRRG